MWWEIVKALLFVFVALPIIAVIIWFFFTLIGESIGWKNILEVGGLIILIVLLNSDLGSGSKSINNTSPEMKWENTVRKTIPTETSPSNLMPDTNSESYKCLQTATDKLRKSLGDLCKQKGIESSNILDCNLTYEEEKPFQDEYRFDLERCAELPH